MCDARHTCCDFTVRCQDYPHLCCEGKECSGPDCYVTGWKTVQCYDGLLNEAGLCDCDDPNDELCSTCLVFAEDSHYCLDYCIGMIGIIEDCSKEERAKKIEIIRQCFADPQPW